VKDKIGLATKGGSGNDKKSQLRAELDEIRAQQSNGKQSRSKIFEQLKTVQESMGKKVRVCTPPATCTLSHRRLD